LVAVEPAILFVPPFFLFYYPFARCPDDHASNKEQEKQYKSRIKDFISLGGNSKA
jgi:hypothetical protein